MGGKMGHLTDEEVIEEQDDRLCTDSRIVGFTDQNRADLKYGAHAGNLRILHHSLNPNKELQKTRRVVATRGDRVRKFRSVSEAVVKMKFKKHSVQMALQKGIIIDGSRMEYTRG